MSGYSPVRERVPTHEQDNYTLSLMILIICEKAVKKSLKNDFFYVYDYNGWAYFMPVSQYIFTSVKTPLFTFIMPL
jgi:hypothetical protein